MKRTLKTLSLGTLLGGTLIAAVAPATHADEPATAVDAQLFKPALDPLGVFSIERARGLAQWAFGLRFGASYAQSPLKLDSISGNDDTESVLDSTTTLDVGLALGVTDRLSLHLDVPLQRQPLGSGYGTDLPYEPVDPDAAKPGNGFYSVRPDSNISPSESPTGDARLGLKYQLIRGDSLALSLQGVVYVPFGDEDVFAGSSGFTYEPKLLLEKSFKSGFVALNAGARLRDGVMVKTRALDDMGTVVNLAGDPLYVPLLYVGSEAVIGVGGKFDVTSRVALGAEAYGLVPLAKASDEECKIVDGAGMATGDCKNGDMTGDVLAGAFFRITPDVEASVGAGAGVVPGAARRDAFRVFAGLTWAPSSDGDRAIGRGDKDHDSIPDGPDVCPDEPEDPDNFQDDDGCPDLDNDLDGALDAQDNCPDEPEDRDGHEDGDGCPEGDNDNDKVSDLVDKCPGEAEDADGFQDDDGCPDEDNDGDGILDGKDQCSNEPESVNGYLDLDGCPDQAVQGGPRMAADRIDLQGERIEFVGKTAKLTKDAKETLDAVAEEMKKPEYANVRVRIEVGVEESGSNPAQVKKNKANDQRLTAERANEVMGYLLSKGIPQQRLDPAGLGSNRPIDARNPKDAKLNRRVEFIRTTQ